MRSTIAICVLFFAGIALAQADGDHYTDKYDNINLDEILSNKKLLEGYIHCILEKGKCTPEGKELKAHIKDALENECAKCTEPQKKGTRRVIGHLINSEPGYWNELTTKYDPDKKYTTKYESELRKIKA